MPTPQSVRVPLAALRQPNTSSIAVYTWHLEAQQGGGTAATPPVRTDIALP